MRSSNSGRLALLRERTDARTALTAIGVAAIGVCLLWLADGWSWLAAKETLQSLVRSVGSLLIASVALGVLWELRGKRLFLDEVLERMQVSVSVANAGIRLVGNQYLREVDWQGYLTKARRIDFFFAYASTWRNAHITELRALAHREGVKVRVVLPDRHNAELLAELARRFGYSASDLDGRIQEAEKFFDELSNSAVPGATIEVHRFPHSHLYTLYRFDDRIVVTMYFHRGRGTVPLLEVARGGLLFEEFRSDFEHSWEHSSPGVAENDDEKGA